MLSYVHFAGLQASEEESLCLEYWTADVSIDWGEPERAPH